MRKRFDSTLLPEAYTVPIFSSHEVGEAEGKLAELFNLYGFFLIQFEKDEPPHEQLLCLTSLCGETIHHDRSDERNIAEIAVSKEFSGYLGTSAAAHPFHTDGTYEAVPPRIIALRCERSAEGGGGLTQLASGKNIYDYLAARNAEALATLFNPDALQVSRGGKSSTEAVFKKSGEAVMFRFRGDATTEFSPDPRVQEGIALIREYLAQPEHILEFSMKPKQVLVADNTAALHGRTAFDPGDSRQMHRLFFEGGSGHGLEFGFSAA